MKKSRRKFNDDQLLKIVERHGYICANPKCQTKPGHAHHAFYLSDNLPDINEDWNGVPICNDCHYSIHHGSNYMLELKLKKLVLTYCPAEHYYKYHKRYLSRRAHYRNKFLNEINTLYLKFLNNDEKDKKLLNKIIEKVSEYNRSKFNKKYLNKDIIKLIEEIKLLTN